MRFILILRNCTIDERNRLAPSATAGVRAGRTTMRGDAAGSS
jgi:hypothetical protein